MLLQSSLKKPVNAENFDALKESFDALQACAFVSFHLPAVMLLQFLPMRPLFFFLLLPFSLFSQERPMYMRVHPGFWDRVFDYIGSHDNDSCTTNGINFYWFSGISTSPAPSPYVTNGVDIALVAIEHKVNGVMVGLFGTNTDSMNGICFSPMFASASYLNGIKIAGLGGVTGNSMNGINISGLAQVNNRGNGLSLSGLTCVYDSSYNGIVLSGIYHRNHSVFRGIGISTVQLFQDANGLAVSGVQTVTDGNFNGISVAGIGNVTAQNAKGLFFSGIYNWNGEDFSGVEISAITNRVRENGKGAQVSLINSCPVMQGTQVGLINWSRRMQGVQVGLLNYNGTNPKGLRLLPLMNFNFRPIVETDTLREKNGSCYVLKSYFKDGRLASVSHYCGGKLNGEFTLYNEFGDKVRETNYVNGKKEGEEFTFDGAGRKTESTFWNADTIVWSSSYDYPQYQNDKWYEKTVFYQDKSILIINIHDGDTLYSFPGNKGYRAEHLPQESYMDLYRIFHYDTLCEVFFITEVFSYVDFNGPEPDSVYHFKRGEKPTGNLVLYSRGQDYDGGFNSTLYDLEENLAKLYDGGITFTVLLIRHHRIVEKLVQYRIPITDSSSTRFNGYNWYYSEKDRTRFRRNGDTLVYMNPAGVTAYYKRNIPRNVFRCDSTSVIDEGGTWSYNVPMSRTDYYKNGKKAYQYNFDTLQTWYSSGKLKSSCIGGTVQSWYPNGNKEYEITRDSLLRYYDRQGHLLIDGRKDTVRIYGKDGALKEKIVFSGYNANLAHNEALPDSARENAMQQLKRFNDLDQFDVIRTQYRNGEIISSDTMSGNKFFYLKNNLLYNVLLKEPVVRMDDEPSEDFIPDLYWYGSNWLWSSLESPDFTRLVSPVKTPRWLRDYFWYDGFERE